MSRYRFELATPADDADLRAILRATPMPGNISIGFQREPSFFAAAGVDGPLRQVVAARALDTGNLIGFGCRSVRDRFVNGEPQPIGYLGTLRLLNEYRNHGLVARGYRYFKELHRDGRTRLYLTTIAEDNAAAQQVLLGGRAGLPVYHDAGLFHTALLPVRIVASWRAGDVSPRRKDDDRSSEGSRPRPARSQLVRPAMRDDVPAIVRFLRETGPGRQFFPCYAEADLNEGTFTGLRPEDILLALRDGAIVGTLAVWDQRCYRQSVVHSYAWPMRWLRGSHNLWSRWRGWPTLPAPGTSLQLVSGALPLVKENDAALFASLVQQACARALSAQADYLALGLHEHDPLLPALRSFPARWYVTRLYHVCWQDGDTLRKTLDGRPPYLELGTL